MNVSDSIVSLVPVILFEDDDVLAIDKPAGLVVHGDGRTQEYSLADWIVQFRPELAEIGETWESESGERILRPGIVHRLDRETSGVMILAKTPKTFLRLKKQFQERIAKKVYHTIVHGRLKSDWGVIDAPIGRSRKDFRQRYAGDDARGEKRDAVTEYIVLGKTPDFSYVEVRPKTGRTHQIRVHMKHIRHPIVSDTKYAPTLPMALGFTRVALHARRLEIAKLRESGENYTFIAPLPSDFLSALSLLGLDIHEK